METKGTRIIRKVGVKRDDLSRSLVEHIPALKINGKRVKFTLTDFDGRNYPQIPCSKRGNKI